MFGILLEYKESNGSTENESMKSFDVIIISYIILIIFGQKNITDEKFSQLVLRAHFRVL